MERRVTIPVEKMTSEAMDSESLFKHISVKQVFLRDPYHLEIHKDVLYIPKPPATDDFGDWKLPGNYQILQKMASNTEKLVRRSDIYASIADSIVASVIEDLSPKEGRSKLLREKLAIIQEAHVAAVSSGLAAASNLQLLCRVALLKNFGFHLQVFNTVCAAPFEGARVLGPEPKVFQEHVRTIRQADRMPGRQSLFNRQPKTGRLHSLPRSRRQALSRKRPNNQTERQSLID